MAKTNSSLKSASKSSKDHIKISPRLLGDIEKEKKKEVKIRSSVRDVLDNFSKIVRKKVEEEKDYQKPLTIAPRRFTKFVKEYFKENYNISDWDSKEIKYIKDSVIEYLIDKEIKKNKIYMEEVREDYELKGELLPKDKIHWTFDSTDFGEPQLFKQILSLNKLIKLDRIQDDSLVWFKWSNKDDTIRIFTLCDPITGEFPFASLRTERIEKGYASSLHIEVKGKIRQVIEERILRIASIIEVFARYKEGEEALRPFQIPFKEEK